VLLVALDNGRVQIDGGDALLRTPPPQFLDQLQVDFSKPCQSIILLGNESNLLRNPPLLGFLDLLLGVKLKQRLPGSFPG